MRRRRQYVRTITRPLVVFSSVFSLPPCSGTEHEYPIVSSLLPKSSCSLSFNVPVILGGAGVGSAVGLIAHHARSLSGDPPPTVAIPEVPIPAA
jgi:hypothetical protein